MEFFYGYIFIGLLICGTFCYADTTKDTAITLGQYVFMYLLLCLTWPFVLIGFVYFLYKEVSKR
jgi:hypothetical protein